jgi:hypothetical protein
MNALRFIKLSNLCINTSKIVSIEKNPDSFKIIMGCQEVSALWLIGSGHLSSELCYYNICKKKEPVDYSIVEKFINSF